MFLLCCVLRCSRLWRTLFKFSWIIYPILAAVNSLSTTFILFSGFILLVWIYPGFATRFATTSSKNTRAKRNESLKKDWNRSFSRFDTILGNKESTVRDREGKKALLKTETDPLLRTSDQTRSRPTQPHAVPSYWHHAHVIILNISLMKLQFCDRNNFRLHHVLYISMDLTLFFANIFMDDQFSLALELMNKKIL